MWHEALSRNLSQRQEDVGSLDAVHFTLLSAAEDTAVLALLSASKEVLK